MGADGKWGHGFSLFFSFGIFCSLLLRTNMPLASGAAAEPDSYYYGAGRKIPLSLSNKVVAVRFTKGVTSERQEVIVNSQDTLGGFSERQELSIYDITLLPLRAGLSEEDILETMRSLNTTVDVEAAFPVFGVPDPQLILTDEFIVKFIPSVSEEQIAAFNALHNVEIVRKPEWTERYTLRAYPNNP